MFVTVPYFVRPFQELVSTQHTLKQNRGFFFSEVSPLRAIWAFFLPKYHCFCVAGAYHRHRMLSGIPEGPDDIISGRSLPLECNLDYMNGGSWFK